MKQKDLLLFTLSQLELLFISELPELVGIAKQSKDAEIFKEYLLEYIKRFKDGNGNSGSRFGFDKGIGYDEKYRLVNEWWNDYRFHLAMAVKGPEELNGMLGNSLSAETMYLLRDAKRKRMPFFATPYYFSLLNCSGAGYDDQALRSYVLYSPQLVETFGRIHAWEREDLVEAGKPNAAGWILSDGHNIHRRYLEVAILIPDTMGRACSISVWGRVFRCICQCILMSMILSGTILRALRNRASDYMSIPIFRSG